MDTLLSMSDNELENISPYNELVSFDHVKPFYPPTSDLRISYLLGEAVVASSYDWVGLYRQGWTSPRSYMTYQWAPYEGVCYFATKRRRVVVPKSSSWTGFRSDEKFQLLYVTSTGHIIGVSRVFGFGYPEDFELFFDTLEQEALAHASPKAVRSLSSDVLDYTDFETITLPSDSDSGNSSSVDIEDESPVKLAWDDRSLVGDFKGMNWLDELDILGEDQIVKEYNPNDQEDWLSPKHFFIPQRDKNSYSIPNVDTSKRVKSIHERRDTRVLEVQDATMYQLFFDEDEEEGDAFPLLLKEEASDISEVVTLPQPVVKLSDFCQWIKKPFSEEQSVHIDANLFKPVPPGLPIPLPASPLMKDNSSNTPNNVRGKGSSSTLHQRLFGQEGKKNALGEMRDNSKIVAIYNVNNTQTNKEKKIQTATEVLRHLMCTSPCGVPTAKLGCPSDCLTCVVGHLLIGHFKSRTIEAEQKAVSLEEKNTKLQKALYDAKDTPAKPSIPTTTRMPLSNMAAMKMFVKQAEETIALLDSALVTSLKEQTHINQVSSEKGQQTESKAIKDASTEYLASETHTSYNSDEEERDRKDGWQMRHTRQVERLMKKIGRKEALVQDLQERFELQQTQLLVHQEIIKDLRKSIKEERQQLKKAHQTTSKLRRQVRMLSTNRKRAWTGCFVTKKACASGSKHFRSQIPVPWVAPRTHNSQPASKPKTVVARSPLYTDKKALREHVNTQMKEGRCRTCSMPFSPKVDKRLIEEHIAYHLQFNI